MSDLDEEYRKFCLNVGHLFTSFARFENMLLACMKLHLMKNIDHGTDDQKRSAKLASAIYGSMRIKASRDAINRILKAESAPAELKSYVTKIFSQVGHIENLRDQIAHQQVVPAHSDMDGYWQVSNHATTRDLTEIKFYVFDTNVVFDAASDLTLAGECLACEPITDRLFAGLTDFSQPAWRYKPSMLKLVPHSKLRIPPEQSPPLKA
jgi:hypothetical protein